MFSHRVEHSLASIVFISITELLAIGMFLLVGRFIRRTWLTALSGTALFYSLAIIGIYANDRFVEKSTDEIEYWGWVIVLSAILLLSPIVSTAFAASLFLSRRSHI